MKRKTVTMLVEVTVDASVSEARARKEVRDGLRSHQDTFYYEDTHMRLRAVRPAKARKGPQ